MTRHDIAQLNVGRAVAPLDDAVMADFMNWLDEINALAERSTRRWPGSSPLSQPRGR